MNNPSVCDRLPALLLQGRGNEFKHDLRGCKEALDILYFTLFSLHKGSRKLCDRFAASAHAPKGGPDICSAVWKMRGGPGCKAVGFEPGSENYKACLGFIPESEDDCYGLGAESTKECNENLKLYKALKSNNPALCPSGYIGVACRAYLTKGNPNTCAPYLTKLSQKFCSGGKYAASRKINLNFKRASGTKGGNYEQDEKKYR